MTSRHSTFNVVNLYATCNNYSETDEYFAHTVSLINEYTLPQVHISQFYPRPGTPAARMKKVPSNVVKNSSRELTSVFEAFTPYDGMEGKVERIWVTGIAADGIHLVGRTKGYIQVLVVAKEDMRSSCSSQSESCAYSAEPQSCACGPEGCGGKTTSEESRVSANEMLLEDLKGRNLIGWLLRRRKNRLHKMADNITASEPKKKLEWNGGSLNDWDAFDFTLVGGMFISLLTILALLMYLGFSALSFL